MPLPDKQLVLRAFHESLAQRLDAIATITAAARDEATSAESRPENKYDTRALEASYLAAGQGERLRSLKLLVAWFEAIRPTPATRVGVGSLLRLAPEEGEERTVLLAPEGGEQVSVDGSLVELIGVRSPLGRALLGLEEDEEAEIETPRGPRTWEIVLLR